MTDRLVALVAQARAVPAVARSAFGETVAARLPEGAVLLRTCHRVEIVGQRRTVEPLVADAPVGTESHAGTDAVRHLVRVAVGLDSAIVGEDQVLHQLRHAAGAARARAPLPPSLDRLLDAALRAGRRARTWLPSSGGGLAELALRRLVDGAGPGDRERPPGSVLVVGAGEMGRRAARALVARGAALFVASRTPERAAVLAGDVGGRAVPFDPGAEVLRDVDGVMVALTGAWPLSPGSRQALTQSAAWIVDLSAPPAIEGWLAEALGRRLTTVDMLAEPALSTVSEPLMRRLEELVEATVAEHMAWTGRGSRREVTRALAARASQAQAAELAALWRRLPGLPPEQRAEVVQMARHLAERLLRDPLEQLDRDTDGQREIAARELFRL